MGCTAGVPRIHAYFDCPGRVIAFDFPPRHFATRELTFVSTHDTKRFQVEDECYLLSAEWHSKWIDFVTKQNKRAPGGISNAVLVIDSNSNSNGNNNNGNRNSNSNSYSQNMSSLSPSSGSTPLPSSPSLSRGGPHLRPDVKPKVHFRPVNKTVWEFLFRQYGGGPVIRFKVPPGLDPDYYIDGSWIKRVKLSEIAQVIYPSACPEQPRIQHVNNPMAGNSQLAASNMSLAGNLMINDLSKSKFKQANAMQMDINQGNADAIAQMMAKDLGKKKMADAKNKQLEANMQISGSITSIFKGSLTKKKIDEAKAAKRTAVQSEIAALFARGNLKKRLKQAKINNNYKELRDVATRMIVNAWRSKKARDHAFRLKMDAMARKVQNCYRGKQARRKAAKLKAEQRKLKEEACAMLLQSNWRIKKSRDKVKNLKREKQHLLEEGAALRVQSRWRIIRARRAAIHMRDARDEKSQQLKKKAVVIVAKFVRVVAARIRLRKLVQVKRNALYVFVHRGNDIQLATNISVYVHIERATNNSTNEQPTTSNLSASLSLYKTKALSNTVDPQWDEKCIVLNASGTDKLVLTVVNQSSSSDKPDEFLGQAIIDFQAKPIIFSGKMIKFNGIELGPYSIPLRDIGGNDANFLHTTRPGGGTLDFSVKLPPRGRSQAGWVMKRAVHMFGSQQYKARFIFLVEGNLSYCDDEHHLDRPRATIAEGDIVLLEHGPDRHSPTENILHIKSRGGEEWFLKWMPNENMTVIESWIRKLQYSCPDVMLNNIERDSLVNRTEHMGNVRTVSTADSLIGIKNTARVVARRTSIFY